MKKIIATAALLLGSASAYAANTATATLQNIQAKYLSGDEVSLLSPYMTSGINFNGNSIDGQHFYDYVGTIYPPQNVFKEFNFAGVGFGSGLVIANIGNIELSSYATGYFGQVSTGSDILSYIDYKANSLLQISAEALISGAAYAGWYSDWYANSSISISSTSFDNGVWSSTTNTANLHSSSTWNSSLSASKQLNLYYYNTVDTRLSLQFSTYAQAQVALVPEPSTYAMLGLGLLGFAARRRKSA